MKPCATSISVPGTPQTSSTVVEISGQTSEPTSARKSEIRSWLEGVQQRPDFQAYERVPLPYGLELPGPEDRQRTVEIINAALDLQGKAIIDVGSHYGGAAVHMLRNHGAQDVLCIETQYPIFKVLERVCAFWVLEGLPMYCRHEDIEAGDDGWRASVVTALNVLHHFRFPIHTLLILSRMADDALVLEWPTMEHYKQYFDNKNVPGLAEQFPLIIPDTNGGFHFTEPALNMILGRLWKDIDHMPSPRQNYMITICTEKK